MMHEKKFGQTKIFIAISIDRATGSIDRKSGKINFFFEKQSILMQKLLEAHCIINKMHEYEMKSFSKILEIFQKQDLQSICPQSANIKHILH